MPTPEQIRLIRHSAMLDTQRLTKPLFLTDGDQQHIRWRIGAQERLLASYAGNPVALSNADRIFEQHILRWADLHLSRFEIGEEAFFRECKANHLWLKENLHALES